MHLVREHEFLCNAAGVQMIRDDIEKEGVTHVMIAACSRRAKTEAFHFPSVAHVARQHARRRDLEPARHARKRSETTQEMADDYVRMGCAEVKKMKLPAGNPNAGQNKRILVVGGGISGMTAALEAAEDRLRGGAGRKRQPARRLGGEAVQARAFREPYAEPQTPASTNMIAAVDAEPRIKVYLNCGHRRDRRRAGALRGQDRHRIGQHRRPRKSAPSSRPRASRPTTSTSCRNSAAARRPTSSTRPAWKSWRKKPRQRRADQAAVRRRGSEDAWCSCNAPASATTPASICPTAPASAAPPASSRRCISRTPTRTVDTVVHLHRPAHARQRRGLLPQRADKGRDLHQGQGRRGRSRRQCLQGQLPRPDPGRGRRDRRRRSGGARHRPGAEFRRRTSTCRRGSSEEAAK